METQTTEQMPRKKNVYNKERYEQNKEEILKYFLNIIFILFIIYYYIILVIIYYLFRK